MTNLGILLNQFCLDIQNNFPLYYYSYLNYLVRNYWQDLVVKVNIKGEKRMLYLGETSIIK